jgi:hypothetical protein
MEARLQDDAGVVVAEFPYGLEDVERRVGVGRAFHVDAHEKIALRRRCEDLAQVVDADRAIDVEPELRQLERQVALDAGAVNRLDQLQIFASGGIGGGERRGRSRRDSRACSVSPAIGFVERPQSQYRQSPRR